MMTPLKRRRKQQKMNMVLLTSMVTMVPINSKLFWAGGDDGCLNWHTFSTHLIPFSYHFPLITSFLILSLSSFSLIFIKVRIFPHIPFIYYSSIFLKGTCFFLVPIFLYMSNTVAITPHIGCNPSMLLQFWAQSNFTLC
jgi:hypothetical protein